MCLNPRDKRLLVTRFLRRQRAERLCLYLPPQTYCLDEDRKPITRAPPEWYAIGKGGVKKGWITSCVTVTMVGPGAKFDELDEVQGGRRRHQQNHRLYIPRVQSPDAQR